MPKMGDYICSPSFNPIGPVNSLRGFELMIDYGRVSYNDFKDSIYAKSMSESMKDKTHSTFHRVISLMNCKLISFGIKSLDEWINYETVPEGLLKYQDIRSVSPVDNNSYENLKESLKKCPEKLYPDFLKETIPLECAPMLCGSFDPIVGEKQTWDMMQKAAGKKDIRVFRLVWRAEREKRERLQEILQKGTKIQVYTANLKQLMATSDSEIKWLFGQPPYIKVVKAQDEKERNPIYILRKDLNTKPHVLGNLITHFCNLLDYTEIKSSNLEINESPFPLSFRGTLVGEDKGMCVVMFKEGPGRASLICPLNKDMVQKASDEADKMSGRSNIIETVGGLRNTAEEVHSEIVNSAIDIKDIIGGTLYDLIEQSISKINARTSLRWPNEKERQEIITMLRDKCWSV